MLSCTIEDGIRLWVCAILQFGRSFKYVLKDQHSVNEVTI